MKILVLTHRLPYAPNRGDRIRAYHLINALAAEHEVHLISLTHDTHEAAQASALAGRVASVATAAVPRFRNLVRAAAAIAGSQPLTHVLLDSGELRRIVHERVPRIQPDLVLSYCTGVAPIVLQPPLSQIPCIVDLVDVDSAKWQTLAERSRGVMRAIYRRESRLMRLFEARILSHATAALVVNEREQSLVAEMFGRSATVIQNGIDLHAFAPATRPAISQDVVFCGVFNYQPNEDGAVWLASDVWPIVKASVPGATLKLVGMNPSRRVKALARSGSIDVTGPVPDVRPYLWNAAVAAAPLSVARGIQNKVLEAIAAGLPCIVTPEVEKGLPGSARPACVTCADATTFANAIITELRKTPEERRALADRADLSQLSWPLQLKPLMSVVAASSHRRAPVMRAG